MATSLTSKRLRALAALCFAVAAATSGTFVGPSRPAIALNNCGILANYECVYLSVSGNGNGSVAFTSYTLAGTIHTVSLAACVRQGGSNSGGCVLGFSYLGTSATSVSVTAHVTVASDSCFSYQGGACGGAGFDEVQGFPIQATVTFSSFGFALNQPEAMHVHLIGTGSGMVTSSPRGISCPSTCSVDFPAGASITLTETPASGDTFGGWGQLCAGPMGGTTCSWTINSTLDINVTFNLPATPPPTPSPKPTPKPTPTPTAVASHGATPRPTGQATGQPSITSAPGRTSVPGETQAAVTGAPTGEPVATPPGSSAPGETTIDESAATSGPSLAPLDTPVADAGQPASSPGAGSALVVFGLVVLLIVFAGGAFVFRRPRARP